MDFDSETSDIYLQALEECTTHELVGELLGRSEIAVIVLHRCGAEPLDRTHMWYGPTGKTRGEALELLESACAWLDYVGDDVDDEEED
jgi:hypothetical protein